MIVRTLRGMGQCVFEITRDVLDSPLYELVHANEYFLGFYNGKR